MLTLRTLFYSLLKLPIKLLVRSKIVADTSIAAFANSQTENLFYIIHHRSASDLITLQAACKRQGLPDPLSSIVINNKTYPRTICIERPNSWLTKLFGHESSALVQGSNLLALQEQSKDLDLQLIPAHLVWGRKPNVERNKANVGTILADQESPSWFRKLFIVLFLGRNSLVRYSQPLSLKEMCGKHGTCEQTAKKLLRVARFHFYRQTIAATGPRLMHRNQMFKTLLAMPSIQRIIQDEAKNKGISIQASEKEALHIMDEIAGDYRDSVIRVGERILTWLWKRLYSKIEVHHATRLRELAQEGHEIIYVPCHRSHMDYLLLTHVIYQQGLVTPRIAAGINLNFWPAGPIFRKAGAFFIRRTFGGNRLYSTIFREYLGLLFERGYAVKYYSEGGRSRTGKLLPPKTGMLAMTIQSLLKGIDRPLTLVPVYLGYEHVMEVGTYHKELSGSKKEGESALGVVKAIKKLRNYGNGYVNFGQPININQFLNQHEPDWKAAVDPIDPQKPSWLTPTVNKLAANVMTSINQSAAINGVTLVALILHATENKAMTRSDLEAQIDFFIDVQKFTPYSNETVIPEQSGKEILDHVISLNKVTVEHDSLGDIISLTGSALLEMRYYRNNILHLYILPSLVCRILDKTPKTTTAVIVEQTQAIINVIRNDFYLWQDNTTIAAQVESVLAHLASLSIAKHSKADFWSLDATTEQHACIRVIGECVDETIQRLAIVTSLSGRLTPVSRADLESKVVAIAKRLSVINNINAPEFIDKKAQSVLINALKQQGHLVDDEQGKLVADESLKEFRTIVNNLIEISVLQSIAR
ncbi:glycerol-3-phosphate 1-O-acyltransferase PlsB [Thalassotalea fusca]